MRTRIKKELFVKQYQNDNMLDDCPIIKDGAIVEVKGGKTFNAHDWDNNGCHDAEGNFYPLDDVVRFSCNGAMIKIC